MKEKKCCYDDCNQGRDCPNRKPLEWGRPDCNDMLPLSTFLWENSGVIVVFSAIILFILYMVANA